MADFELDRPVRWRRRLLCAGLLPAGLGLQLLARRFPGETERWFARGLFPSIRDGLARLSGLVPVSVAELSLVGLLALGATLSWRRGRDLVDGRRSCRNVCARSISGALATGGVLYVGFVLSWGLNYARLTFAELAELDVRPATVEELRAATGELVTRVNELRERVEEDEDGVFRLIGGKDGVLGRLEGVFRRAGRDHEALAGPAPLARLALLSPVLTLGGLTGVYSPFTAEAHVNGDIPDASLPFVLCHEAAHQRGFAREEEANFIAYRVCVSSSEPDFRYAGALAATQYGLGALQSVDGKAASELAGSLSDGVQRDRAAIRDFWATKRPQLARSVSRVVWNTNDLFLKSQGQAAGAMSYGEVVDLLIAEWRVGR